MYSNKVSILTDEALVISALDDASIDEAVSVHKTLFLRAKKSNLDLATMQKLEASARFAFAQQIAKGKSR